MIELRNVYKSYASNTVLKGVSAEFARNKISIVLGQSGVGKSVLMKAIVGLETIDKGHILFDNDDITKFSEDKFMKIRKKCCYNFQLPALLKGLNVFQNVALPLTWQGKSDSSEYEKRVYAILQKMGLENSSDLYPSELSYGMQKKVSFARSLIMDPDYIIFDEPTSGLDPLTSKKIYELIKIFVNELNKGVIVITHDIDSVSQLAGTVNLLREGNFIFQGDYKDFFKSNNPYIEEFFR